jgi:hypothetical protein
MALLERGKPTWLVGLPGQDGPAHVGTIRVYGCGKTPRCTPIGLGHDTRGKGQNTVSKHLDRF